MNVFGRVWLYLLSSALVITTAEAQTSEWIVLNPLHFEVFSTGETSRFELDNSVNSRYNLQAGFQISQNGYAFHPAILSFSYTVAPKYGIGEYTYPYAVEDTSENQTAYALNIEILNGATLPVSGSIAAANTSTVNIGSLGQRTENQITQFRASLFWKFTPFPTEFSYLDKDVSQINTSSTDPRSVIRDEHEQKLKISSASTKMKLDLEHVRLDDRITECNNDFNSDRARLQHTLLWGKGSSLNSRINYQNRTGFNPFTRLYFSESARIKHKDNLTSMTNYRYSAVTQNSKSTEHRGLFKLQHSVYNNLTNAAEFSSDNRSMEGLIEKSTGIELQSGYSKSDIKGVNVSAFVSGRFSRNDRESSAGYTETLDEAYKVPITGEIFLNKRYIDIDSIIITDAEGTYQLTNGVDYEIIPAVDDLTRLYVIPGGQITQGDIILASYRSSILPSIKYDLLNTTMSISLSFKGWSFSYWGNNRNNKIISGQGGSFLSDTRQNTTRLSYTRDTERSTLQISAERQLIQNGELDYESIAFNQSLAIRLSPSKALNFNLTESFYDFTNSKSELYFADIAFNWRPNSNWLIQSTLGAWWKSESGKIQTFDATKEDIFTASLQAVWTFRKLSLGLSYNHNRRTGDYTSSAVSDNFHFHLRRRFR